MKKGILVILYFLMVGLGMALFGLFFPPLNLDKNLLPLERGTIRFLATWAYSLEGPQFILLACFSAGFFLIGMVWLIFREGAYDYKFSSAVLLITFLLNFFFWTLSKQVSPTTESVRNELPATFLLLSLAYLAGMLVLGYIFPFVCGKMRQKRGPHANSETAPAYHFQCPKCGAVFQSNVIYCTQCREEISVNKVTYEK